MDTPDRPVRSAERYRHLFEAMDEGFCIIEFFDGPHGPLSDYIHIEANSAYARHAGIENVVGQKVREMVPDEADGWVELYGSVLRTGKPIAFQRELVATGRHLDVSAFRLGSASDRQVAVLFKDVTDRMRAEAAQQQLNETLEARVAAALAERAEVEAELRQAHKMEAVGQLTGGIAHDFNNMLTGVIGAIDIMRRRLADGRTEGLERFMDAASASAHRAAALTARLLAFSRRQSLDPRPVEVGALIAGLESLLRHSVSENVRIRIVTRDAPAHAVVDANQLENALLNLVINARDAMPEGGTLTIEVGHGRPETRIDPTGGTDDYVVIAVADTGVGMPAEVLDRVFEPFFSTKPLGQGTGLGLSMAYGFAEQSGGHIGIDSTPGAGTTVRIYLPVASEAPVAEEPPVPPVAQSGSGQTVLLVEDDDSVRLLVREVLEELSYRALEAEEAGAAIAILASDAHIDLMVSDVGLPGMNGRQLADIAREYRPDLPVLFVTGYAEHARVRADFLGPNMTMITKPFAIEALSARIRGMIGAEADLTDAPAA